MPNLVIFPAIACKLGELTARWEKIEEYTGLKACGRGDRGMKLVGLVCTLVPWCDSLSSFREFSR